MLQRAEAVRGVSFDIGENETVALVGESGSGKSVTAMSILNLLPENAQRTGAIEFGGRDLLQCSLPELQALRGENYRSLGQPQKAETSYQQALRINSGNKTASEGLARLSGEFWEELRRVVAEGPVDGAYFCLHGAMQAGCAAAFIARPGKTLFPLGPRPDVVAADLGGRFDDVRHVARLLAAGDVFAVQEELPVFRHVAFDERH